MTGVESELSRVVRDAVRAGFEDNRHVIRQEVAGALERGDKLVASGAAVSTKEAAKIAGRTPKTICRWVKQGRLNPLGEAPYMFSPADVVAARDRLAASGNVVDLDARADTILRGKGGAR